jgi:hypothetical protein
MISPLKALRSSDAHDQQRGHQSMTASPRTVRGEAVRQPLALKQRGLLLLAVPSRCRPERLRQHENLDNYPKRQLLQPSIAGK